MPIAIVYISLNLLLTSSASLLEKRLRRGRRSGRTAAAPVAAAEQALPGGTEQPPTSR